MNAPALLTGLTRTLPATLSLLLISAAMTFAAEPQTVMPAPSKEMREKMAAIHDKMAACLRSEKAFADCRDEMHRSCSDMMGEHGCPMMGMGMRGRMMAPQQEK